MKCNLLATTPHLKRRENINGQYILSTKSIVAKKEIDVAYFWHWFL
jgi:hypothetical protein